MNKGPSAARAAAEALAAIDVPDGIHPFVIPPFTSLEAVAGLLEATRWQVGAQNMHWEDEGAWTGEISPPMVRECGATLIELGHSERREHFGETDVTVNLKVKAALHHGLSPLICIGDSAEEYASGATHDTLARQVRMALHELPAASIGAIRLAYEPVWAIGAQGRAAESDFVAAAHARLRSVLAELAGVDIARRVPILYGGSVSLENASGYTALADVDGVFIGRSAWSPAGLEAIIRSVAS
ncbi:triosephosphate isomerase [Swaminathania salitolerans LMG 21291]|uniref:Triosephosphate isomerase n=2 Tax=Swaminathania salitolerans TaxID=182838 RepID=A0A511BNM6_9PROT|nr:triosephosphate isomerase [Swaminathania salitolerans LMG 21291]GEL01931.1 triosephosphate isomerase [Swaminathania salitolerans]